MAVICTALMISDAEAFLMYLLVICLSLEKCFFRFSSNFFLLIYVSSLDINPLI